MPINDSSLLKNLGIGCAGAAICLLAIAIIAPASHSDLGDLAGAAMFMAFLFFIADSFRRREPFRARSGDIITADRNPVAYGLGYMLLVLFGVIGLLVFLIIYIMS
jgi:hypothetical protein